MRRLGVAFAGLAALFLLNSSVRAATPIDELEKDLQDVKENHQTISDQALSDFLNQTLTASQDSNAAFELYQTAGGAVPGGAPIQSQHAHETTREKENRQAQDSVLLGPISMVAQLHCGMLHYAVVYVTNPSQKGLHEEWVAWLKAMPQIYTQIKDEELGPPGKKLKSTTMKDSVIGSYFNFFGWKDKEQAGWAVSDLPKFYRTEVLEPLRVKPTADTMAAWDTYISLRNSSQPDGKKWNVLEYPALMFDRGTDDYAVDPSMEKLQVLVELIKANPACPSVDDMIGKVHDLMKDYRQRHPGAATPQASAVTASAGTAPSADSNVTVTKTTQGDMTIITTQTNAVTTTPPPAPPQ